MSNLIDENEKQIPIENKVGFPHKYMKRHILAICEECHQMKILDRLECDLKDSIYFYFICFDCSGDAGFDSQKTYYGDNGLIKE
jgi:hypothetical protein